MDRNSPKRSLRVCVMVAGLTAVTAANAQQCAMGDGLWRDNYWYEYNLDHQSGQQLSGTVRSTPHPWLGQSPCARTPYPVTGQVVNGVITLTMVNPAPDAVCAAVINYTGTLTQGSCNTGGGTYTNSGGGYGSWVWSKDCDLPNGDVTAANSWASDDPAIYEWRGTVQPTSRNYRGRRIGEDTASAGTDSCYFPGSAITPQTSVTGTSGILASNDYADRVGWASYAISYYRQRGRAPCQFSIPQRVLMACGGVPSMPQLQFDLPFATNTVSAGFTTTTVWSSRAGQTVSKSFP